MRFQQMTKSIHFIAESYIKLALGFTDMSFPVLSIKQVQFGAFEVEDHIDLRAGGIFYSI